MYVVGGARLARQAPEEEVVLSVDRAGRLGDDEREAVALALRVIVSWSSPTNKQTNQARSLRSALHYWHVCQVRVLSHVLCALGFSVFETFPTRTLEMVRDWQRR